MNVRSELLNVLQGKAPMKCATVKFDRYFSKDSAKIFNLKVGYDVQALNDFLHSIDFEYDDGFGSQEIFGCIWLEDGTWFTRGEYDGSEWWEYHAYPEILEELL